jgi:hypothetical protein
MKKALTFGLATAALALVAFTPLKSAQAGVGIYVGPGYGYYGGYRPYRYGYPYAYYPYWRRPYYPRGYYYRGYRGYRGHHHYRHWR